MCWLALRQMAFGMAVLALQETELPTPHLHRTTEAAFIQQVEVILRKHPEDGVDMDVTWESDEEGCQEGGLIDCAAAFGYALAVQRLIDHSGGRLTYSMDDESPLHFAVDAGHLSLFPLLVQSGCPVDGRRDGTLVPIEIAILNGDIPAANSLVDLGAHPPLHAQIALGRIHEVTAQAKQDAIMESKDWAGRNCLHYAAAAGNQTAIRWLLHRRILIDRPGGDHGLTALHYAAMNGRLQCCRLLLENGANVNFNKGFLSTSWIGTPLHVAAETGHKEVCELLIASGARVNERNFFAATPLHAAVQGRKIDAARLLIQHGGDVNAVRERVGRWHPSASPLHIAASAGDMELARLLLQNGASIDLANKDGDTPLHTAVASGGFDFAKFLVESGADRTIRNASGETAADVAGAEAPSWLSPSRSSSEASNRSRPG